MVQASDFYEIIASSNEFCGSANPGSCSKFDSENGSWLKSLPQSDRFIGDIDLPEGMYTCITMSRPVCDSLRGNPDQEPLLQESKRRFVLFPIQYPEVNTSNDFIRLNADNELM